MNTIALSFSVASFVVVMGTWISYLATVPRHKVPVKPVGSVILQCMGIGLAISAIIERDPGNTIFGAAAMIPALLALMMGLFFLWLLSIRKTPIGDLKVKVGDRLLPFKAFTSEGAEFHTDELSGKRTVVKFFRGGW